MRGRQRASPRVIERERAQLRGLARARGRKEKRGRLGAMAPDHWPIETYAAHALARWAWRSHEFLVALLLVELVPGSLRSVAIYGVCDNAARLFLTPAAGAFVDRAERLKGTALMLLLQNASILASACAAAVALASSSTSSQSPSWPLLTLVVAGGALSGVGSAGAALGVEREWPAIVAEKTGQSNPSLLSTINSRMRAIDLGCQLLAPAAAGLVMSSLGARAAALASAAFCALAWPPQVLLLRSAVRRSIVLAEPKRNAGGGTTTESNKNGEDATTNNTSSLAAYLRQPPLAPAFALALLYCTVLSLGMMMTAFLKTQGLSEASIAAGRGAGALSGIGAALAFPQLAALLDRGGGGGNGNNAGVAAAGLLGNLWQLIMLLIGAMPTLLSVAGSISRARLWLLVAGLVASRAGLWTYDLAVTQLQQSLVSTSDQAKVGGVQAASQAGFELLSFFAAALLFPQPGQFPVLIALSLAVVATAALLYGWWWSFGFKKDGEGGAAVELAPRREEREEEDDGAALLRSET